MARMKLGTDIAELSATSAELEEEAAGTESMARERVMTFGRA
jgi:hypothetical protein